MGQGVDSRNCLIASINLANDGGSLKERIPTVASKCAPNRFVRRTVGYTLGYLSIAVYATGKEHRTGCFPQCECAEHYGGPIRDLGRSGSHRGETLGSPIMPRCRGNQTCCASGYRYCSRDGEHGDNDRQDKLDEIPARIHIM